MKTFLILSDTHGNRSALYKLKEIMEESDYVIHLGDYYTDILSFYPTLKNKIYSVKGNCDGSSDEGIILEVEGRKIFITHGDKFGVKSGLTRLKLKAESLGADTVLFGHTHRPTEETVNGITFINPGTLSRYGDKTYAYMVAHDGNITVKHVNIP